MKRNALWALAACASAAVGAAAPPASAPAAQPAVIPVATQPAAVNSPAPAVAPAAPAGVEAPLEVREDHHAWTAGPFFLQKYMGSKEGTLLPAGTLVRVEEEKIAGTQHWRHLKTASGDGWAVQPNLTAQRPAGLADTLAPMVGDRSAEIARIRADMDSPDLKTRIAAYKSLQLSGITDEALFDEIAHRFAIGLAQSGAVSDQVWRAAWGAAAAAGSAVGALTGRGVYSTAGSASDQKINVRDRSQTMPWQARALGSSGYSKYWRLLDDGAADTAITNYHIDDHSEVALNELDKYAVWNRIINSADNQKDGRSADEVRTLNMLRSGIRELQRESLKRIKEQGAAHPELYDEVEAQLVPSATVDFGTDREAEDAAALMTTALASSANAKYVPALQKVSAEARSEKLKKYADKALAQLQGPAKAQ